MGQGPGRVQEHGCGREQEPRARYGHGYGTVQRPGMMQDTGQSRISVLTSRTQFEGPSYFAKAHDKN